VPPVALQVTAVLAAFVTVAVNWRVLPAGTDAEVGEMATETAVPAVTVTVVVALEVPPAFVAVKVYVVVALGVTVTEVPVTGPGVGEMLSVSAPVTDQFSVTLCPAVTVAEEGVKLEIAGGGGVAVPLPNLPNWSAGSPLPTAPILPPDPSCGSPAPISGLPVAGEYIARYVARISDTFFVRLQISSGKNGNGSAVGAANFGFRWPLKPPRSCWPYPAEPGASPTTPNP
jgi:hypothetical protein